MPRECQHFAEVAVGKGEGGRGRVVGGRAAAVGKARGDETKGELRQRARRRGRQSSANEELTRQIPCRHTVIRTIVLCGVNYNLSKYCINLTGRPKWSCTWVRLTQIWGVPLAGGLLACYCSYLLPRQGGTSQI